jgi:hypothetical protein
MREQHFLMSNTIQSIGLLKPIKNPLSNELAAEIRGTEARRKAVSAEELTSALSAITDFLQHSSTTGGGRRLRQFVWSLWNESHLTDAIVIVFHTALVGVLSEEHLRKLLTESGEMARWDSAQRQTPEHLDVFYPPYLSARSLKDLAAAAQHYEQSKQ